MLTHPPAAPSPSKEGVKGFGYAVRLQEEAERIRLRRPPPGRGWKDLAVPSASKEGVKAFGCSVRLQGRGWKDLAAPSHSTEG